MLKIHPDHTVPIIENPLFIVLLRSMISQGHLQVFDNSEIGTENKTALGETVDKRFSYVIRKGEGKKVLSATEKKAVYITVLIEMYY